jgi:hypothetical protein
MLWEIQGYLKNLGVTYVSDTPENHWQTSCETFELLQGDCEDLAALIYRLVWIENLDATIVILEYPDHHWHTMVQVEDWLLDITGVYPTKELLTSRGAWIENVYSY